MFADSHCHLTDTQFDSDREAVIERARAAGVSRFIVIGATGEFSHNESAVALARENSDIFAVVGVHPHDAKTITAGTYARLRELTQEPKVVGLGETGLDFYYDNSPREDQRTHFRAFIRLARELRLPLSMHVREAYGEAVETLRAEGAGRVRGVMHCFTGSVEEARALLDLDLFLSFSGIVTFKNAHALREAAQAVPLGRLLIETDCPLLAPVPYRGKRNEPAYVVQVAKTLAEVKELTLEEVAAVTRRNTEVLFAPR
ncbi:MAG TPA: TatD family hydrolase [Candidatus Binatia bacterium]|jgi:TatD DNase family protein|nr:TatD family hydrolase [Candidatus Binatia bacterium]